MKMCVIIEIMKAIIKRKHENEMKKMAAKSIMKNSVMKCNGVSLCGNVGWRNQWHNNEMAIISMAMK